MNSKQMKYIAIVSMVIDHIGAVFFPDLIVLRIIGRLAFPIFVFLVVQGLFHTASVQKYAARLLTFALVAEIPYDLCLFGRITWQQQNVLFTLFLGLIMINYIYYLDRQEKQTVRSLLQRVLVLAVVFMAAVLLNVEYGVFGLLLMLLLYLFVRHQLSNYWLVAIAGYVVAFSLIFTDYQLQIFSVLSLVWIGLYNPEAVKFNKYIYYCFYPVHLLLLYAASSRLG